MIPFSKNCKCHCGQIVSVIVSAFLISATATKAVAADSPKAEPSPTTDTKSAEPKRLKQGKDGTIVLPARDVTVHGTTIRYEPDKNTIGYWLKQDDWVSWELEVTTPGKFTIELFAGCATASAGSHYTVEIAEQKLQDKVQDTGGFHNFRVRRVGEVTIDKPGNYTLSVKVDDKPGHAVMDLRQVVLSPPKAKKDPAKPDLRIPVPAPSTTDTGKQPAVDK